MLRTSVATTTVHACADRVADVLFDEPWRLIADVVSDEERSCGSFRAAIRDDAGSGPPVEHAIDVRFDVPRLGAHRSTTALALRWRPRGDDRVVPAFDGALEAESTSAGLTRLALRGRRRVPAGVAGRVGDVFGGGRIADGSIAALLEQMAQRLEVEVERRRGS